MIPPDMKGKNGMNDLEKIMVNQITIYRFLQQCVIIFGTINFMILIALGVVLFHLLQGG